MTQEEIESYIGLDEINNSLKREGCGERIAVEHIDDSYAVYITLGDNKVMMSCGLYERELRDNVKEIYDDITRTYYAVTYTGLSESERDANGFTTLNVCSSYLRAKELMDKWIHEEIEDKERDYVVTRKDNCCRISWAGNTEQVVIALRKIHISYI